jgi:hypothetical protein
MMAARGISVEVAQAGTCFERVHFRARVFDPTSTREHVA